MWRYIVKLLLLIVPTLVGAALVVLLLMFDWAPPLEFVSLFRHPWENVAQLVWPIVSVGYRYAAMTTCMTRSTVLEVIHEDYVRTAWVKGLGKRLVVLKYVLKNAILPVTTIIGTEFAFLIGGLVVTETVFTLSGLGRFMVAEPHYRSGLGDHRPVVDPR